MHCVYVSSPNTLIQVKCGYKDSRKKKKNKKKTQILKGISDGMMCHGEECRHWLDVGLMCMQRLQVVLEGQ